MKHPFEIGEIVHFKLSCGFPAGMVGVVIGLEVWLNEDTTISLDALSMAPESLLSAEEASTRVVVQIPLKWPENQSLAKIKLTRSNLGQSGYLILHSGPRSLELDSTITLEKRDIEGHKFWDAFCDHDRNIYAKGATKEMARLKLAHEIIRQPSI